MSAAWYLKGQSEGFSDIQELDVVESYIMVEVPR